MKSKWNFGISNWTLLWAVYKKKRKNCDTNNRLEKPILSSYKAEMSSFYDFSDLSPRVEGVLDRCQFCRFPHGLEGVRGRWRCLDCCYVSTSTVPHCASATPAPVGLSPVCGTVSFVPVEKVNNFVSKEVQDTALQSIKNAPLQHTQGQVQSCSMHW